MPDLVIRIKKKTDGSAALSCTRADGSVTWQRQTGQLGSVFPLHDLTHYAVETVLGFRRAFYGLLAEGWDIADFGKPGAPARLPEEARLAETIVGCFDLERMTGVRGTADECNERIRMHFAEIKQPPPAFALEEDQATHIRALRAEVFEKWNALPAGEAIEIPFERRALARSV